MDATMNDVIRDNKSALVRIAGKFTSDPYEKEELVQETWIRSLSSLERFIGHPKLISWLYVIMKNVYINKYRKINMARKMEKELPHIDDFNHPVRNHAFENFMFKDVEEALSQLSPENYTLFSMYIEGYSYREISIHNKLKEGTVKSRIHHIRKILKRKLQIYEV